MVAAGQRMPLLSILVIALSTGLSTSVYVDLKFDLKLKHVPHDCRKVPLSNDIHNSDACKLSYAISVLESFGDFDLQAIMLQDGYVKHYGKERRHFREDTVVPLPASVQSIGEGHVYIGIKIYGLPKSVQDYFIVDVTKLLKSATFKTVTSVDALDFTFSAIAKYGKLHPRLTEDGTFSEVKSCGCQGYACSCCSHIDIAKIDLNETGCLNVTYLPNDYGLALTLSLNGRVVYNDTISARNPPPVCFNVPYLKEYASLCIRFHDLDITHDRFNACARVEAELYHVRVGEKELGCFHLGPLNKRVQIDED